jgi:hypothetical protein
MVLNFEMKSLFEKSPDKRPKTNEVYKVGFSFTELRYIELK